MMTVPDAAWEHVNKTATRGITFGVALKHIRNALLSGQHPEDKIHDIEISMNLINDDLDKFIKGDD